MRERPIGDLVTGLKQLGADVDCFLGTNCPPVRIVGKSGLPGGKVSFHLLWHTILMLNIGLIQIICLLTIQLKFLTLVLLKSPFFYWLPWGDSGSFRVKFAS